MPARVLSRVVVSLSELCKPNRFSDYDNDNDNDNDGIYGLTDFRLTLPLNRVA